MPGLVVKDDLYYIPDERGGLSLAVYKDGTLAKSMDYSPFGDEATMFDDGSHSDCSHMSFTSYERDNNTGLDFVQARYYMKDLARFTQEDTNRGLLSMPQSLNYYTHCFNDPINLIDLDGNAPMLLEHADRAMTVLLDRRGEKYIADINDRVRVQRTVDGKNITHIHRSSIRKGEIHKIRENIKKIEVKRVIELSEIEKLSLFLENGKIMASLTVDSEVISGIFGVDKNELESNKFTNFEDLSHALISNKILKGEFPNVVIKDLHGRYRLICSDEDTLYETEPRELFIHENTYDLGPNRKHYVLRESELDTVAKLKDSEFFLRFEDDSLAYGGSQTWYLKDKDPSIQHKQQKSMTACSVVSMANVLLYYYKQGYIKDNAYLNSEFSDHKITVSKFIKYVDYLYNNYFHHGGKWLFTTGLSDDVKDIYRGTEKGIMPYIVQQIIEKEKMNLRGVIDLNRIELMEAYKFIGVCLKSDIPVIFESNKNKYFDILFAFWNNMGSNHVVTVTELHKISISDYLVSIESGERQKINTKIKQNDFALTISNWSKKVIIPSMKIAFDNSCKSYRYKLKSGTNLIEISETNEPIQLFALDYRPKL